MTQMYDSGTMTREEKQQQMEMQRAHQMVMSGIQMYEQNPNAFNATQVRSLVEGAQSLGIDWSPSFSVQRAFKKGLYELGEGLSFGLVPNSWDPGAYNAGEEIAGGIGGLLGLAAPIGVGAKAVGLARGAATAVGKGLPKGMFARKVYGMMKGPQAFKVPKTSMRYAMRGANSLQKVLNSPGAVKAAQHLANSKWGLRFGAGFPAFAMSNRFFDDNEAM
jgi:hypothetical protein